MKSVLLAADASPAGLRAARLLGEMARKDPDLKVTVFHVVPLPEFLSPAAAAAAPLTVSSNMEEYMQTRLQEVLAASVEALKIEPERVRTRHAVGTPADALLAECNSGGYDLVVMGRRGLSQIRELFLGSVSQAVLHRAHCPVLIVP